MTGIRLLLIAFMGWAFCGIFPQLRSVWIALAILLTVPINILQAWISKTFQINTSEKFVFGLVFFLFGGLVHNNIIHLFVIAGLAIVYVFSFRYLKKETEDETEPQIQTNPNQQTEGSSPENRRPKYIKYLFLLVLVPVLLLSSCGGSEAPETEKSAPTVPETTIAATEMTEPTARETVVETTAAAEDPTETVIETTQIITEATQAATEATTQATEPTEEMVWIPTGGGTKYHSRSTCSNMSNPSNVPLSTAISRGFTPCKRCH